ncbi:MAG TPA: o-succinylbenzoate--CoA ligase [Cellulomonadaceae bacterium]|nr:o-succinylbenzoate--CoA ligase [Cellulomonadaceae bacterium]
MSRPLIPAPVSASRALDLLPLLDAALSGDGPAIAPTDPAGSVTSVTGAEVPDDVAVVLRTSGSTGASRAVMLGSRALRASAEATARALGATGGGRTQWLLALPPVHVAGVQVVVRSVLAGTVPAVMDLSGGFRAASFAATAATMTGDRRHTSLVPTQLVRLLDDSDGVRALRSFDAVLLGGAATTTALLARARGAGIRAVTTYGMTETCGGCVYDGRPLDGVRVDLDDEGRILLGGPVLATGYLGRPDLDDEAFVTRLGERWLRTSDLGTLDDAGRLRVTGRVDDVIISGGVKVSPAAVEHVLAEVDGVAEVCVVGLPDDEWGQSVTAVLVLRSGARAPTLATVRAAAAERLGAASAPRDVVVVGSLPLRGPGKPDRRAAAALARELLAH